MSLLNLDYLVLRLEPSAPSLQLVTSSDLESISLGETGSDKQTPRMIAENIFFNWIFDQEHNLLGVELDVCPGDGVLETYPHVAQLPYVENQDPFLFIWFTHRRCGEPRRDLDWASRVYAVNGKLIVVLGTGCLVWEGEKEQLIKLCEKNQSLN